MARLNVTGGAGSMDIAQARQNSRVRTVFIPYWWLCRAVQI